MSESSAMQACLHVKTIAELVKAISGGGVVDGEHLSSESAKEWIWEYPLSVSVRTGWVEPSEIGKAKPGEYRLLLETGGESVRVIGNLDSNGYPSSAHIEHAGWFEKFSEHHLDSQSEDAAHLLTFARMFCYVSA